MSDGRLVSESMFLLSKITPTGKILVGFSTLPLCAKVASSPYFFMYEQTTDEALAKFLSNVRAVGGDVIGDV